MNVVSDLRSFSRFRKTHFLPRKCPSKFRPGQSWSATLAEGPFFKTASGQISAAGRKSTKTGPGSTLQGLGKWDPAPTFVQQQRPNRQFFKRFECVGLEKTVQTWNVWKSTPFLRQKKLKKFLCNFKNSGRLLTIWIVGICPLGTDTYPFSSPGRIC